MEIYVVRHGQTVVGREPKEIWDSYGPLGPPLNDESIQKSRKLQAQFRDLGIDVGTEPAAISQYLRTRQTAVAAGFKTIHENALLNEINTENPARSQQLIKQGQVPEEARVAAEVLLLRPLKERVWFTHGLVIAALLLVTGQNSSEDLEPPYAEIIKIQL